VSKGNVISVDPPQGTSLKRNAPVTLTVSDGPRPVGVPNVVGVTVDQAKAALADMKLVPDITYKHDDTIPQDQVMSQDPVGNATAPQGSTVHLIVSKGPPIVEVARRGREEHRRGSAADHRSRPDAQRAAAARRARHGAQPVARWRGTRRPRGSTVTLYVFRRLSNLSAAGGPMWRRAADRSTGPPS